jgi:hypothetical protein
VHPDENNAIAPVVPLHNLMGDAGYGTAHVLFI